MKSGWCDEEAQACVAGYALKGFGEDLALRVYTSRLIGRDASLVLHGGGNTSVKTRLGDDLGRQGEVLCVKGSGWSLGDIEPAGLPAVRLDTLRALRDLDALGDEDMVNAQRTRLLDSRSPNPSVETLLHAFLPHKFIDHSHADAILSLVDQAEAADICREVYGDRYGIVPYVMPGFSLSRLAVEVYEQNPEVEGLLLLQHGLFSFGSSARESYERHIEAVDAAERHIAARSARSAVPETRAPGSRPPPGSEPDLVALAPVLRGCLAASAGHFVLHVRRGEKVRRFVDRADLPLLSQRGCATPDHVIRTKAMPLLLELRGVAPGDHRAAVEGALDGYRERYRAYVARQRARVSEPVQALDPEPRVVLVPGLGLITVGRSESAAAIAADIYEHTIDVIEGAEAVGHFQALPENDLFDMEYWSLEQAKLGKGVPSALRGRAVYITGAASGIGEAIARRFATAGASLFLVDRDGEALRRVAEDLGAAHCRVDLTDAAAVGASIAQMVSRFGGVDGVVSNAGIAPQAAMDACPDALLRQSFEVNFFAHQSVASEAMRVMRRQGSGGFLLFNASKAALDPGKGFGPYAIAKAALLALMKQYALEGGEHGIRANAINADRVRTPLLPEQMVRERAAARGLEPDAYFRSNLLGREVMADDVARSFLHLALAESTTGAIMTVDGGNLAAAPR